MKIFLGEIVMADSVKSNNADVYTNEVLNIENNVLSYGDSFVEISNISRVAIYPIPRSPFPFASAVICLIGLAAFQFNLVPIGVIALIIGGAWIVKYFKDNQDLGSTLNILMNSGHVVAFQAKDKGFLQSALKTLMDCANDLNGDKVTIDFSNSTISNSAISSGKNSCTMINK